MSKCSSARTGQGEATSTLHHARLISICISMLQPTFLGLAYTFRRPMSTALHIFVRTGIYFGTVLRNQKQYAYIAGEYRLAHPKLDSSVNSQDTPNYIWYDLRTCSLSLVRFRQNRM